MSDDTASLGPLHVNDPLPLSSTPIAGGQQIQDGNGNWIAPVNPNNEQQYENAEAAYNIAAAQNEQDAATLINDANHAKTNTAGWADTQLANSDRNTAYAQSAEAAAIGNALNTFTTQQQQAEQQMLAAQQAAAATAAEAAAAQATPPPANNPSVTVQETPGGTTITENPTGAVVNNAPSNPSTPTGQTNQTGTGNATTGGTGSNELTTAGTGVNYSTYGDGQQQANPTEAQDRNSGSGSQTIDNGSGGAALATAPVSSSPEQASTSGSSDGRQPHRVVPGDTLSAIAEKYGVSLSALEAANPGIPNPNLIFPGQLVHIPGAASGGSGVVSGGDGSAVTTANDTTLKNSTLGGAVTEAEKSFEQKFIAEASGSPASKHSSNLHGA